MYATHRTPAIAALILAVAAAGCDNATEPSNLGFDAARVESSTDALVTPIQGIVSPTTALQDAFSVLVDQGLTFASPEGDFGTILARGSGDYDVAGELVIPDSVAGKVYVFVPSENTWQADTTRTGAPAGGVRIIWYTSDVLGNYVFPLEERGFVDVTDEDDGTGSRIGLRMVAGTPEGDVTLADFIESIVRDTTDTALVQNFEALGYYGGQSELIDFLLDYDVITEVATENSDFTIAITLEGAPGLYQLQIDATEAGGTGAVSQVISAQVEVDDIITDLDLTLNVAEDETQSGEGTLTHDGQTVALITVEANNFRYTDANGESFNSSGDAAVDSLVRTLYLSGLSVLLRLPLLFL